MTSERLSPGNKLLLAGPAAVARFAINKDSAPANFDQSKLLPLIAEYRSIYDLLNNLVSADNLFVINTQIYQKDGTLLTHLSGELSQEVGSVQQYTLPNLHPQYHNWPRDAHSIIGGKLWANQYGPYDYSYSWRDSKTLEKLPGSALGEGGAVLTRKEAVLIGEETSWDCEEDLEDLRIQGKGVGVMPIIDPFIHNVADHIDGYSTLIEDRYGDLVLLVARSYHDQTLATVRNIDVAAKQAGVGKLVVDDEGFPPMAFNLVQFDDLHIAMTSGANKLQSALVDLIGFDYIHTTTIPIEHFPLASPVSIRCLTNIAPSELLSGS